MSLPSLSGLSHCVTSGLLKFLRLSSPLTRRRVGGDGAKVRFCERRTAEGLKEELLYV